MEVNSTCKEGSRPPYKQLLPSLRQITQHCQSYGGLDPSNRFSLHPLLYLAKGAFATAEMSALQYIGGILGHTIDI